MLSQHTVATAVKAAGLTAPFRFLPVTGSTNVDAWKLAEEGSPEWTVVVAGRQTAGRGRLGRIWVTPPGDVIHVSVVVRPRLDPASAPLLSLAVGVAAAEACRDGAGVDVRCKWPNDLLAGGRKLGGILTEASVQEDRLAFVVVGIGINVSQSRQDLPEEVRDRATSIAIEGGEPDTGRVLAALLSRLRHRYGDRGDRLGGALLDRYRELCDTLGRRVQATTVDGDVVEGTATAVAARGGLIVETAHGPRTVEFGEVVHLS